MSRPDSNPSPIGGYFELELPASKAPPLHEAIQYQSARAAFRALIRTRKPKRVWMPRYICDAMLAPLYSEGTECVWYDVDERLGIDTTVKLGAEDWLLYVNYFGVCNGNVAALLQRFPAEQLVLDFSQAFFEPPAKALATIYSPRKFCGIPDGGLMVSGALAAPPETEDRGSLARTLHLMQRLGHAPEAGYADYQRAEEGLADSEPKRMSKLTERIFTSIDFARIRAKRHDNFAFLHDELGGRNTLELSGANIGAPLCYPFQTSDGSLRQRLIDSRIFIPIYWPDAINRVRREWAVRMIENVLPLPIDQRYGREDMARVVSIIDGGKI